VFAMDTNRKGAIAEAEIALEAIRLGIPVLKPVAEHGRYDLGLEVGGRILRVQCKWGALEDDGAVIKVALQSSCLTPAGYVRSPYGSDEIDVVAGLLRAARSLLPSPERFGLRQNLDLPQGDSAAKRPTGVH
jgi:hypothetical protein